MTFQKNEFIVLEGPRGSGKSTMMKMIENGFHEDRHYRMPNDKITIAPDYDDLLCTREVGGTPQGEHIRKLFNDEYSNPQIDATSELLLINAARRIHLKSVIIPKLMSHRRTLVICDRFLPSTYAFQSGLRGIPSHIIIDMHKSFCFNIIPDKILYLDIPPSTSIQRTQNRKTPIQNTPTTQDALNIIRKAYKEFGYRSESLGFKNFITIDATQPKEKVFNEILQQI